MDKYKKVYIEITNNCNLNCSFCSPVKKEKRFMTEEEFEHILKEVSKVTKVIYLHVKGEPLLHPKIIDFLKLTEKYNLKVNLTTNGILFPKLVEKLKDCKSLHKINFSNAIHLIMDVFFKTKRKGGIPPNLDIQIISDTSPIRKGRSFVRSPHPQNYTASNYRIY